MGGGIEGKVTALASGPVACEAEPSGQLRRTRAQSRGNDPPENRISVLEPLSEAGETHVYPIFELVRIASNYGTLKSLDKREVTKKGEGVAIVHEQPTPIAAAKHLA